MRTDGEADGGGGGGGGGTHIHPLSLSIFFQGPRAFEPLPSSYTWKRQCRRRMAGRAFARSKFNRLVPLAHLPPPLQRVSPSDRWDGAGPLIEPHLIAKEGPSPSEHSHSLLFFCRPSTSLRRQRGGRRGALPSFLSWAASEIKFSGGRGTKKKGHKMGSPTPPRSTHRSRGAVAAGDEEEASEEREEGAWFDVTKKYQRCRKGRRNLIVAFFLLTCPGGGDAGPRCAGTGGGRLCCCWSVCCWGGGGGRGGEEKVMEELLCILLLEAGGGGLSGTGGPPLGLRTLMGTVSAAEGITMEVAVEGVQLLLLVVLFGFAGPVGRPSKGMASAAAAAVLSLTPGAK